MSDNVYNLYPGPDEKPGRVTGRSNEGGAEEGGDDPLATNDQRPHDPPMDNERLAKIEGILDGLRAVPQLAVTTLGIVMGVLAISVTIGIFELNSVTNQIKEVGAKIDAVPKQITDEFRAMRAETAAQTSAIANSITAARQFQPQIVVMPTPQQAMPANDQNPEPLPNQKFEFHKQAPSPSPPPAKP